MTQTFINALRALEKSGRIYQIELHTPDSEKGSLTNFNVTIRSIRESQPQRKTATDSVWGMDGEYDFSFPETYSRRQFDIVFNIYSLLGDAQDLRDEFVDWLKSADCRGNANASEIYMTINTNPRAKYKNLWVSIGDFNVIKSGRGKYETALPVTISTDPRFEKDGVMRI